MGIPITFLFFSYLLYRPSMYGKALLIKKKYNNTKAQSQFFIGTAAFALFFWVSAPLDY